MSNELELPAAYADNVVEDYAINTSGATPVIINIDPEPNEANVFRDSLVKIDIACLAEGGIVDLSSAQIYINGALAFSAGVFQLGFDGPGSAYSNPQPDVLRVIIDATADFASQSTVSVRVVANGVLWYVYPDTIWSQAQVPVPTLSVGGALAQNISAAGDIASAEAIGTPQLNQNISAAGDIASAEAIGGATVSLPFDPASLALTGWWRDYASSTWAGTASAGTSGSHGITTAGSDPAVGSLNGHGTAHFNGTTNGLLGNGVALGDLVSVTNKTMIALINADAAAADNAAWYADPGLIASYSTQEIGLAFSSAGAMIGNYDGAAWNRLVIPCSTGTWHLVQFTHDGSTFRGRVDSGGFSTQASGTVAGWPADGWQIGTNSTGGVFFHGQIAEIMTSDTVLSDTDLDNIKAYINTRYGLAL